MPDDQDANEDSSRASVTPEPRAPGSVAHDDLASLLEEHGQARRRPPRPGVKAEPTQETTLGSEAPQGEHAEAPGGPDELLAGGAPRAADGAEAPRDPKTTHGGSAGLAPKNGSGQGGESA